MKILGVIPSRYASTRFPGKPLALIAGRPLLQWVVEGARQSRGLSDLVVATDDERIADLARGLQVEVQMTPSNLPTGTDRVWAVAQNRAADVVLNIQGDEPLLQGELLDALIEPFRTDSTLEMATLGRPLTPDALASNATAKIVCNYRGEALYFSRFPVPYSRLQAPDSPQAALKHIGLYAYRKEFLQRFCAQTPVAIEENEGLEQLRALYLGARIRVVQVGADSWGVDTPEDVLKIEKILQTRGAN